MLINPYILTVGSGYDPDAQAFLTAAAISDITIGNAINTLVLALKAASLWTKIYAMYPFVGGTAATNKFNLKDPRDLDAAFRLTFTGPASHGANGYNEFNNGASYADTHLVPSAVFTNNDTHVSTYQRQNLAQNTVEIGVGDGTRLLSFVSRWNADGNSYNDHYGGTGGTVVVSNPNAEGHLVSSRVSNTDLRTFRNGSQIGSTQTTSSSVNITLLTTYSIYLLARNASGTASFISGSNLAFASIGSGLTPTNVSDFYTAVQAFETALTRQV